MIEQGALLELMKKAIQNNFFNTQFIDSLSVEIEKYLN
jgi:hypothetical protein